MKNILIVTALLSLAPLSSQATPFQKMFGPVNGNNATTAALSFADGSGQHGGQNVCLTGMAVEYYSTNDCSGSVLHTLCKTPGGSTSTNLSCSGGSYNTGVTTGGNAKGWYAQAIWDSVSWGWTDMENITCIKIINIAANVASGDCTNGTSMTQEVDSDPIPVTCANNTCTFDGNQPAVTITLQLPANIMAATKKV